MSVLRKICGVTRKDKRRYVDIWKELLVDKDTIDLLQVQRLTYFGHVNCMGNDRYPKLSLHDHTTHRDIGREEGQKSG